MKKFLTFAFAALFAAGAWAHQYAATVDGVTWYYNRISDGKGGYNAEITYRGSSSSQYSNEYSGSLTIPSTLDGYKVTTIGSHAFDGFGSYAFGGFSSLTSVAIPESVTSIGEYAFWWCSSLTSITIPASVTKIGKCAFSCCSSLTSVTIPDSVTTIGERAFSSCGSLQGIEVEPTNASYCSIDGVLYSKDVRTLVACPGAKTSVMIPDGVATIGAEAFYDCSSLKSVTIGNGVTTIGDWAFYSCSSLTSVTIPESVTSIGSEAFENCSSLTSVTMPENVTIIGDATFWGCSSLASVTIPESVTTIGDWAFGGCSSLTSVTIPDSVTTIGSSAFSGCSSLTSVTIPDSVTSIGSMAFYSCSSLTSVTIPDSVTMIEDRAFSGCSSLTSATIGNSVTTIGNEVFYNCSLLESVTIGNGVTTIGDRAFYNCSSLTSVTIPDSVTTIGSSAFYNCSLLESVTIGNGVTTIGDWAFYNCSLLESVTIGNGVTTIGSYAFYNCSSLTSVTIPDSVTMIEDRAFSGCSSLTSATIGNSVTTIGNEVFYNCSLLESVTIGNGVTTIGEYAFYNCSSLTSVTIPDSVTRIGSYAFWWCRSLISITIPASVTKIGMSAFGRCYSLKRIVLKPNSTLVYDTSWGVDEQYVVWQKIAKVAVSVPKTSIVYDGLPHALDFGLSCDSEDFDLRTIKCPEIFEPKTNVGRWSKLISDKDFVYIGEDLRFPSVEINCDGVEAFLEILPRSVVVKSGSDSKVYDGQPLTAHTVAIGGDGFVEGECSVVVLISRTSVGTSKNAIAINWTDGFDESNYDILIEEGELTILPAQVDQVAKDSFATSYVYDGEEHTIDIAGLETIELIDPAHFSYALSTEGPWFEDAPKFRNADAHSVWYKIGADNYDDYIQEAKVTISPRAVSVKSESASKVYDGKPLTAGYEVGGLGFIAGECEVSTTSRVDVGNTRNVATLFWAEGASADNYDISIQEGELTVLPRSVSITSGSASKVYDGTPLTSSYSVGGDGFVTGECDVSTSSRTTTGSGKNEVTLNWEEGASADNYDISIQEGELTVLPRSVSITSGSASKVYDGTPLTASYSIGGGGFVDGECDVSVSSRTAAGSSKNEVTLSWAEGASADNYAITIKEGTLTITPAKVPRIATTAFSTTYSYDGEEHTINVAGVESITLIDPPRFSYALSAEGPWQDEAPTFKDAGRYSVWYKISADNYEDYIQEASVTILPRKMVVSSGDAEKFYDGIPLTCSTAEVTVGGLVDGDAFTVNFTGAQLDEGESQNTFDIVWDVSAKESNYEVRKDYGTLKVTRLFGDVGDESIAYTYPYSYKKMTEVTFREGVEMITYGQFSGCDSLRTVKFPDSLRVIDCHALDGLPNIEWQIIDGYKMMDGWIFGYTGDAAEEIQDVDNIRGIAAGALDGCQAIRRFVCSEASKLKAINSQAFRYCTKLETVVLPEGLERIDDEAFIGCTKMANVIVPSSVESVGGRAFKQCTMLTNAQIAHGVKSIGKEAFHSDWRIAEVDIPSTVTNVGANAFGGDSSIIRAGMRGDICKISEVFSNYEHIREFTIKEGDGKLVDALFENCRELVAVRIMGDCPKMVNDGSNLYRGAGIVEMGPDDNHSEGWINEKATVTYVTEGSAGWDGIPGSEALPQSWPLTGGYRRSIAFWDVPTYLCQFDANGGTLGVQDTYQYSEKKIVLPPEPVQSGYIFAGWWTQPTGGLRVTEDTIFIEGVYTYLWAHWVKGHWVFLDPNGGECINEFVTYVDQSVYGVLPTPVKSGYSFGGWLYNGIAVEPETQINEKADHTLVAQWTANKYKVQYHPNGGVGELVNEDWVYGETKTLRRNAFSRVGYDFVGWSTNPNATTAQYRDNESLTNLTTKAGEVLVLYAVWEKSAAVDPTNVVFTNGGDADWQQLSQLVAKDDGMHSVATPVAWQSGKIGDNESSVLKTKVCGKGTISFWWRVSCESFRTIKLDHLAFAVDGEEIKWINGDKDWTYFEAEITSGGEHEVVWSYIKDDEGSDGEDCSAVCAVVWTPRLSDLSDYLNADDLTITTTGAADWFGTTEVSHDGAGAAQSGKIGDNQESRLETTVDGSGTIAFWWKVDCEAYRTYKLDHVAFFIDGVEQKWINGNKDWMRESFEVSGAGAHTLAWVYAKDEEGSDGEDCAWVDEIVWSPAPKPSRPEIIEGASEAVKVAFDQWVADYGVSNPSAANVNAFVLGLAPTVTEEAVQKVVEEELQNLDFSKLSEGDISAAVAEIQAKYPNAKVDLAPVEDLNTSAHLYKLVIKLK